MQRIEKFQEVARSAALLELWAQAWVLGSEEEAQSVVKITVKILEKEEVL